MALPPLPPITRIAAAHALLAPPREQQAAGVAAVLRLALSLGAAGDMLARSEDGRVYRLGHGESPPHWQAGQTLLVRVLRAGPPLEIQVLGTAARDDARPPGAAGDPDAELPALRPDQAGILRLAAGASDAMAQAAHWRQLMLGALRDAAPLLAPPPSVPVGTADTAAPLDPSLLLRHLPWHNWPLSLWLEQRRWTGGINRRARRRASTRLCLLLTMAPWGTVALELDVLDAQVGLTLRAQDADAIASLRQQIAAITARLSRAGLQLMRCQVRHAPDLQTPKLGAPSGTTGSHELPLALFRAGSEALEALRHASDALHT